MCVSTFFYYVEKDMLKDKKAVIFDLDGTLCDSMWVWTDIDRSFFDSRGIEVDESELQHAIEGMSFSETAEYFVATYPLPETAEELMDLWNEMALKRYQTDVQLKVGVRDYLDFLRGRGFKLAIATSNSRRVVETFLNVQGIADYFSAIATSCEVHAGKPAPDVYLETAKKLDTDPADCLVFEDLLMGIEAGQNAGMTVCTVDDDYSHFEWDKKKAKADYAITTYTDPALRSTGSAGA